MATVAFGVVFVVTVVVATVVAFAVTLTITVRLTAGLSAELTLTLQVPGLIAVIVPFASTMAIFVLSLIQISVLSFAVSGITVIIGINC